MEPKNVAAVKKWIRTNRPDLVSIAEEIFRPLVPPDAKREGMMLLLLVGFEAGREFQKVHPDIESGVGY